MKKNRCILFILILMMSFILLQCAAAEDPELTGISIDLETQTETRISFPGEVDPKIANMQGMPPSESVDTNTVYRELNTNGEIPSYSILGEDERELIPMEKGDYPYSAIAKIKSELMSCSGFMIGPHYALTAAHCVYDPKKQEAAYDITVCPGQNGESQPYGCYSAAQTLIPEEYYAKRNTDFDLAVIYFEEPVGEKTGWLGYHVIEDDKAEKNAYAWYLGYGDDSDYMYKGSGNLLGYAYKNRQLKYDIDTQTASSGAPVFVDYEDNMDRFVGINITEGLFYNYAVRLTFENMRFLQDYYGK